MSAGTGSAMDRELSRKVLRAVDNRLLKLTLMPTEKCNFRCTYCYEDFERGAMPGWVVKGLKRLMTARSPELHVLDLRWFGGEPLLAFPVIEEISLHALALEKQHPRLNYVSSITTNGFLLTPDRFRRLLALGVRQYQISLDGVGEKHDRSRRRIDGKGTFGAIWSNLLAARSSREEFSIMLRVHFGPGLLGQVEELIEAINRDFGDDPRYRVFFKAITRLGGPNNSRIPRTSAAWQEKVKARLGRLVRRRNEVVDPAGGCYVCYAAEPNSLVVRSDGQLARCTVAFDDPRNQVGYLRPDGTLAIDLQRSRLWFAGLESLDPEVLRCPLPKLGRLEPALVQLEERPAAAPGVPEAGAAGS